MNRIEAHSLLFTDSFVANLALYPKEELAIYVMKAFGGYDKLTILMISSLAAALAMGCNYLLGRVLFNILLIARQDYILARNSFTVKLIFKYNILFLLLSGLPFFGKFIQVAAGFWQVGLPRTLLIGSLAKLAYYIYIILV